MLSLNKTNNGRTTWIVYRNAKTVVFKNEKIERFEIDPKDF